jgi:RNA-binding protein
MSDKKIPNSIKKMATSREFQPSVRVGKSGITDTLIEEIDAQLAKKDLVKIKINRGLFDRTNIKEVWTHLAENTNSTIVSSRGNVCVLWR